MSLDECANTVQVEEPGSANDGLCRSLQARPVWNGPAVLNLAAEEQLPVCSTLHQDPAQSEAHQQQHQRQIALQWLYGRHPTGMTSCWPKASQAANSSKRPRLAGCQDGDAMQAELDSLRRQNQAIIKQLATVLTTSRDLLAKNNNMQKAISRINKQGCGGLSQTYNHGDYIQTPVAATAAELPPGMFARAAEPAEQTQQPAEPSSAAANSKQDAAMQECNHQWLVHQ